MQHDNGRDNDVHDLLMKRAVPPPSSAGFAERIIHAALAETAARLQNRNLWTEFLSMFALPHPAITTAAFVVIGLVAGLQAGDSLGALPQDWSAFLDINDSIDGGWL